MSNLLVGNGLSISISQDFSYSSLRERVSGRLSPAVDRLFKKLDTDDFEHLLAKIKDARDVIEAITDGQIIVSQSISEEIRSKLIEAIQSMNPRVPMDHGLNPQALNSSLKEYNKIFTTNYDVYLYWARKGNNGFNIIDFFFNSHFDRNNVERRERKAIYFLHGALFLFEEDNKVIKIGRGQHPTLDEAVQDRIVNQNSIPLFISEGSPQEKLANIKKNEYLSFCYDSLRAMTGSLDVYGHSLNPDVDNHIIEAIADSSIDKITYYQHKFDEMTEGNRAHLQTTLNTRLGLEVEIKDSSEHALLKWRR